MALYLMDEAAEQPQTTPQFCNFVVEYRATIVGKPTSRPHVDSQIRSIL